MGGRRKDKCQQAPPDACGCFPPLAHPSRQRQYSRLSASSRAPRDCGSACLCSFVGAWFLMPQAENCPGRPFQLPTQRVGAGEQDEKGPPWVWELEMWVEDAEELACLVSEGVPGDDRRLALDRSVCCHLVLGPSHGCLGSLCGIQSFSDFTKCSGFLTMLEGKHLL